ncbi:MAG: phosphate signaling complex protein PhoU [Bacteroidales bacterium]|nr:phosphate signaling complex protein PhoU [Bacteroidales bacterium]
MLRLELELNDLKIQLLEMWQLVYSQLEKSKNSYLTMSRDLAFEVISMEKKVDAFELLIDQMCEQLLALKQPMAIDLRFILSSLKINGNLERIGDLAYGIARQIFELSHTQFDPMTEKQMHIEEMFNETLEMLLLVKNAFEKEDNKSVSEVLSKDDFLDNVAKQTFAKISNKAGMTPEEIHQSLLIFNIIRKLERAGDHCSNIAEEITFYLDAVVLKHGGGTA